MLFISRVLARQTRIGSPSWAKCRENADHSAPLRACGDEAHSNMAPGMVAWPGLIALMISISGSELDSSVGQ